MPPVVHDKYFYCSVSNYPRMRQRTNPNCDTVDSEFIDEDEQEQVVGKLQEEVSSQIQASNRSAAIIGVLSVALNTVLTIMNPITEITAALFLHLTLSSGCHLFALLNHAKGISKGNRHDLYLLSAATIPCLMLALIDADDPTFELHRAMFVGNMLTTCFAVWLRRDSSATLQHFQELVAAKYKYKSL